MRIPLLLMAAALAAHAETYTLTLKQATDRAAAQNPDTVMARLDELKASQAVKVAQSPFKPRVTAGSGLAYSSGFPLSIEGSAPAAFEVKANQYLFNRPQSWAIEQAKESARGANLAASEKGDEAVYRVATLYVDVARASRLAEAAKKQVESLGKVLSTATARVEEGRELPVAVQQAKVNLLRAEERSMTLESDRDYAERTLAITLGYTAGDLVQPADEELMPLRIPESEDAAVQTAIASNKELKRLQSNVLAKGLEIRSDKAQYLPRVDLVAQYALLTKYSHYQEYFAKFERNNGQVGASIQVPLFTSASVKAIVAEAETEQRHMQNEADAQRNRVVLDVHQSYQEVQKADIARQLAQADLDLARSQLSVVLALMDEGRATLSQVEEARFAENEKWIAFYDAEFGVERARLSVLRQTGELRAALQ
ncbi:MAG TPA: TolC family protein [Bryobacteraceae bacterium]|nr:TolC family protein [Bryobacteraceae bacterium]